MREKLNDNPIAQVVLVAVLLLVAVVFLLGKMGGGEEEAEESAAPAAPEAIATAEPEIAAAPAELPPPGSGAGAAPAPPQPVVAAFESGQTVVLLFVRTGGIDDRLVTGAVKRLESYPDVATFLVPSDRIARYVAIAQGVDLNRLPSLVVIRPKHLDNGVPVAFVKYGFQSPESIVQSVVDANYRGATLPYHP
ncbi:MAG: hypothetical protein ACJ76D_11185 [Solirubrobacterales bacterium]